MFRVQVMVKGKQKRGKSGAPLVSTSAVWKNMKKPYEVLGFKSKRASREQLRNALRQAFLTYHPKLKLAGGKGGDSSRDDKCQELVIAYRIMAGEEAQSILSDQWDWKAEYVLPYLKPLADDPAKRGSLASPLIHARIFFMETDHVAGSMPHTNYVISVNYCMRMHVVRRRYTEFEALHAALLPSCSVLPTLPDKSILYKLGILDETDRAMGLNSYLQGLLSSLKGRGRFSVSLLAFLGLDETTLARVRCEEEMRIVGMLDKATPNDCEEWYILPAQWVDTWRAFVTGTSTKAPGRIPNHTLWLGKGKGVQSGLRAAEDYRCVNRDVWTAYVVLYGVRGKAIVRRAPNIDAPEAPSDELSTLAIQALVRGYLSRQRSRHDQARQRMTDDRYKSARRAARRNKEYIETYERVVGDLSGKSPPLSLSRSRGASFSGDVPAGKGEDPDAGESAFPVDVAGLAMFNTAGSSMRLKPEDTPDKLREQDPTMPNSAADFSVKPHHRRSASSGSSGGSSKRGSSGSWLVFGKASGGVDSMKSFGGGDDEDGEGGGRFAEFEDLQRQFQHKEYRGSSTILQNPTHHPHIESTHAFQVRRSMTASSLGSSYSPSITKFGSPSSIGVDSPMSSPGWSSIGVDSPMSSPGWSIDGSNIGSPRKREGHAQSLSLDFATLAGAKVLSPVLKFDDSHLHRQAAQSPVMQARRAKAARDAKKKRAKGKGKGHGVSGAAEEEITDADTGALPPAATMLELVEQQSVIASLNSGSSSGSSGRSRRGDELKLKAFVRLVQRGQYLRKFSSKKRGGAKTKLIVMDERLTRLEWMSDKKSQKGKKFGVLLCEVQRVEHEVGGGFAFVFPERKLKLQVPSTLEGPRADPASAQALTREQTEKVAALYAWGFGEVAKARNSYQGMRGLVASGTAV